MKVSGENLPQAHRVWDRCEREKTSVAFWQQPDAQWCDLATGLAKRWLLFSPAVKADPFGRQATFQYAVSID